MKHLLLTALAGLFLFPAVVCAQSSSITGVVTNDENAFLSGATVTLNGTGYSAVTNDSGAFVIEGVPYGDYVLTVSMPEHRDLLREIKVEGPATDLGFLVTQRMLVPDSDPRDEPPMIAVGDDDVKATSSQTVSGSLSASRDAFASAASYVFSSARFRMRGYDNENFETYVNGAPMENLENGRTQFFLWSGLNDMTRNRENVIGLSPATYAFGGIGGSTAIDARASRQRKQLQASYAASNRSYENRLMVTWGSGLLKGGWAFAASISRRWADEAYVPGTYYDGIAWYAAAEKMFGTKHSLGLTVFNSPSERGKSSPAIQEMYDLAGTNYYNPAWGYQNGKKRNALIGKSNLPTGILSHEWKISNLSGLKTSLSVTTGENSNSALDWYNAPDPRPDFYRKLPSFIDDPETAAQLEDLFRNNEKLRQIQWDELYLANYNSVESIENANGVQGNTVTGKRSHYIVEERVQEGTRLAFSSVFNTSLNDITFLTAGVNYQNQELDNYKRVKDLLGGDFYVDLNQYAEQDFPNDPDAIQNDVNNPNRILYEGDKFGYNYTSSISKTAGWIQGQFKYQHVDLFAAFQISSTQYSRTGHVKNGLFQDNSYGESDVKSFVNSAVKGGLTYKVNGRNFLFGNLSYQTRAPYFENAFVSVRTRNEFAKDLTDESIFNVEGGYMLKSPKVKARAVFYMTDFKDQVNTVSFYHGDYRTYVNYTLTGIDKRHVGTELALDLNLGKGFTSYAVAAIGDYYYTSRPKGTITADNTSEVLAENETIYAKNLKVGGSPQNAYTLGLGYRAKKFWFVNMNFNYFDKNYVEFNPARRTQSAVDLVPEGSDAWNSILEQEKLDAQFTVDLFAGKSWKLNNYFKSMKRNTFFLINLGVSNLLDNTDLVTGGFEQLRYDFQDKDPNTFPSKYFYSFGRTYYINLILRMN